ncbi:MAG: radical SAM family heme chaperone HemW [Myxococcales bacterium]|nr:radical SAM family heme chaperone HemW [Myxococcales bacterium]
MAGIYIHVPFCAQPCSYCDFYFTVSKRHESDYLVALEHEIELQRGFFGAREPSTLYFGGGTPSRLSTAALQRLIDAVRDAFPLTADAEITLEANPDDLTRPRLSELRATPINRLSIGIQSFHDDDLRMLNRAHTSEQACQVVADANAAGFENLSIDLIFALPSMTLERWSANIERAIALDVPHISCYSLQIEDKTALATRQRRGEIRAATSEARVEQYVALIQRLEAAGYEHYELTNFARPGHHSRHNLNYWSGEPYLGLGPSAHSFDGHDRFWTVRSTFRYARAARRGELAIERETPTPVQRCNEMLMTSLRTIWGLDLGALARAHGRDVADEIDRRARRLAQNGYLRREGARWFLCDEGKIAIDELLVDLFLEEEFSLCEPNDEESR